MLDVRIPAKLRPSHSAPRLGRRFGLDHGQATSSALARRRPQGATSGGFRGVGGLLGRSEGNRALKWLLRRGESGENSGVSGPNQGPHGASATVPPAPSVCFSGSPRDSAWGGFVHSVYLCLGCEPDPVPAGPVDLEEPGVGHPQTGLTLLHLCLSEVRSGGHPQGYGPGLAGLVSVVHTASFPFSVPRARGRRGVRVSTMGGKVWPAHSASHTGWGPGQAVFPCKRPWLCGRGCPPRGSLPSVQLPGWPAPPPSSGVLMF